MPIIGLFIVGAASQYLGAAAAVFLFGTVDPATVAWLRTAAAAGALLLWRRPWRMRWSGRAALAATGFGVITVFMNVAFYEAIARIPLGTAVAIEFLGPLAVATFGSRRIRDLLAVVLVAGGVFLLAGAEFDARLTGILFALAAAALWVGYIVLGKRVADAGDGLNTLAVGMAAATAVTFPFLLLPQAMSHPGPFLDARTWALGMGVGVLSSAVPYAFDQLVLSAVGRARFALFLALLPTTATVVGAIVLRQLPSTTEFAGMLLVTCALVTSAVPGRRDTLEVRDGGEESVGGHLANR